MKMELVSLVNREAQTSNTAVYRKDLPKAGCYSAIDVGIRVTNGATSALNMSPIDLIKRIALVVDGNENRIYVTGNELFRHNWMKSGQPMSYNFTEAASGVQEVWFRLEFGRFLGDQMYGLDLSKFDNVQVQVDYDCTIWGAVAATTFTTGTFAVTLQAHQFPINRRPSFRGMIGLREFYTGTTATSGELVLNLPSNRPVTALSIAALCDNVDEWADITDIRIGKDNFASTWINNKCYNLQKIQNEPITVRELCHNLLLSDNASKDTFVANIKAVLLNPRTFVLAVA